MSIGGDVSFKETSIPSTAQPAECNWQGWQQCKAVWTGRGNIISNGRTAIDPVSKFWLAFEVGDRGVRQAWGLVHKVASALREGIVPLFITDGNRACEQPLLSHYGEWREPQAGQRKARWVPLPQLQYAQVVKKRRRRRIVSVSKRVVFGSLTRIKEILTPHGWQINTAFVERHNLTLRRHIAGLGRRVNTLAHSPQRPEAQAHPAMAYYNSVCLPVPWRGARRQWLRA